jgi:hypothetical protein
VPYALDVVIQDSLRNPRAGVPVEVSLNEGPRQGDFTDDAGVARFVVPDIAIVTIRAEGHVQVSPTRERGARVQRIAMLV